MKRLFLLVFACGLQAAEPLVTVTIDSPTNVVVKVVLTNSIPPPKPPTNSPPVVPCADDTRTYILETSSGPDGFVSVYRVAGRVRTLLRKYRPAQEIAIPPEFAFAPIIPDSPELDVSPGGRFRELHPDGN